MWNIPTGTDASAKGSCVALPKLETILVEIVVSIGEIPMYLDLGSVLEPILVDLIHSRAQLNLPLKKVVYKYEQRNIYKELA